MTERDFQAAVIELARLTGWQTFHPYDSRRSAHGWPDLTLVRPPELLIRELKTDSGRVRPAQQRWLDALAGCGVDVEVWRPRDWPRLAARLQRRVGVAA